MERSSLAGQDGHQGTGDNRSCSLLACLLAFFLGLQPRHMEVPRLGIQSELQLPAYTTAIAVPDLSHICKLHCSSWQQWILNPLARPGIEPVFSWIYLGLLLLCHNRNNSSFSPSYWFLSSVVVKRKFPQHCFPPDCPHLPFLSGTNSSIEEFMKPVFIFLLPIILFVSFFLFSATPKAYGGSKARGPIRAPAASLHHSHSNVTFELHVCNLHHSSRQHQMLNPLIGAYGYSCFH